MYNFGHVGLSLEPFWASLEFAGSHLGPNMGQRAPLGSSLSVFDAMLCDLDVSLELFAHPWSLPCAILGQIGIPRFPVVSCAHLEAYLRVSGLLHSSDAQ